MSDNESQATVERRRAGRKLIEKVFALYGKGHWWDDPDTTVPAELLDCFSDDVDWWVGGRPDGGQLTKDDFRKLIPFLRSVAASELKITPTGWTIDGERYAVEAFSHLKLKNGGVYSNRYHILFEIRGDKITRYHEHHDSAYMQSVFARELELRDGKLLAFR